MAALILFSAQGAWAADYRVKGTATFYCSDGRDGSPVSPCTRGYGPSDLVGAIDRKDSSYRKGDRVKVVAGGRSVTVLIVDTCACAGGRVIDLTIGAFQELRPWTAGEITVRLIPPGSGDKPARPEPTLPPTDATGSLRFSGSHPPIIPREIY